MLGICTRDGLFDMVNPSWYKPHIEQEVQTCVMFFIEAQLYSHRSVVELKA